MKSSPFTLLLAALILPSLARAEVRAETERTPARALTLTSDPVRPLVGVVVINGEAKLGATRLFSGVRTMDVGAGGFIAMGQMRSQFSTPDPVWEPCSGECRRTTVAWAGAQAVVYVLGSFERGMQVGVETSYLHTWRDPAAPSRSFRYLPYVYGSGGSIMAGAVIGYKYVTNAGFTFNPQVAVGPLVTTSGDIALGARSALQVGWSF